MAKHDFDVTTNIMNIVFVVRMEKNVKIDVKFSFHDKVFVENVSVVEAQISEYPSISQRQLLLFKS